MVIANCLRTYGQGKADMPDEREVEERLKKKLCIHYKIKDGVICWCESMVASEVFRITIHLEEMVDCILHPILTHCPRHLSPVNLVRAKTTEWTPFESDAYGWSELILWQSGEKTNRKWNYCFNHHEEWKSSGKMIEWNTAPFLDFLTRADAKAHAYQMYEKYARNTPISIDSKEDQLLRMNSF